MNIYSQVTNLELSKRLEKLGVKQDSYFSWCEQPATKGSVWILVNTYAAPLNFPNHTIYSAFTVAELLKKLPRRLESGNPEHPAHRLVIECQDTRFMVVYICVNCVGKLFEEYDEKLVDAIAMVLIYLVENDLITL